MSSCITVCVGQAGTQLGTSLLNSLPPSCDNSNFYEVKSGVKVPHAVLVDTEPKVIDRVLRQKNRGGKVVYSPANCITAPPNPPQSCIGIATSGSGNNFAIGRHYHLPLLRETIVDRVRKEFERCDLVSTIKIVHSAGGGTGSGLGSGLTEILKDEFSNSTLANMLVLPFSSGEVIVQDYNVLLSLSSVVDSSDCIFRVENEMLMQGCKRGWSIENPVVGDLNEYAASMFAPLLSPHYKFSTDSWDNFFRPQQSLQDIIHSVVPNSYYKFPTVRVWPSVAPKSREFEPVQSWSAIFRGLNRQIANSHADASCGNVLILSGLVQGEILENLPVAKRKTMGVQDVERLNNRVIKEYVEGPVNMCDWSSRRLDICSAPPESTDLEGSKSTTLITNNTEIIGPLENALTKAIEKFDSGAYLHRYEEHGVEKGEFEEAFRRLEKILHEYRTMII